MTRIMMLTLTIIVATAACACKGDNEFTREGGLRFVRGEQTLAVIDIEIADDQQQRTRGLMYRDQMDEDRGMLFIFEQPEPRRFWMKNTHIPLDILFADEEGVILRIARDTTPYSTRGVPCSQPALYVVEVNAGYTARHDIREGDRIEWERK